MLGRDAQRQEYWHFKDDAARIYIRREETFTLPIVSSVIEGDLASPGSSPGFIPMTNGIED